MSISVKLFMSGRSQAIPCPAKLRVNASEVRIERLAGFSPDQVWLSAIVAGPSCVSARPSSAPRSLPNHQSVAGRLRRAALAHRCDLPPCRR